MEEAEALREKVSVLTIRPEGKHCLGSERLGDEFEDWS